MITDNSKAIVGMGWCFALVELVRCEERNRGRTLPYKFTLYSECDIGLACHENQE